MGFDEPITFFLYSLYHVFSIDHTSIHSLKQAPRAWYEKLISQLLEHEFSCGNVYKTVYKENRPRHPYCLDLSWWHCFFIYFQDFSSGI